MSTTTSAAVELRLARAEKHLKELEALIGKYVDSKPYTVAERFEPKRREYVYRLERIKEPDDEIAVVIGDVLHSLRSILNYCMAGIVPSSRRSKTQFPIFTEDPFRREPGSRRYVERKPDRRRTWNSWVKGADPQAIAVVKAAQPFKTAPPGLDTYLSLLNALNNADKHSRLTAISDGVSNLAHLVMDLSGNFVHQGMQWDFAVLQDGTEIYRSPTRVQVQIDYRARVGIEIRQGKHFPVGELLSLIEEVREYVVKPLTPYFRR